MHAWLCRVLDFEALHSFHYSMVLKRNFQVFFSQGPSFPDPKYESLVL